jgi:hypothetical protein
MQAGPIFEEVPELGVFQCFPVGPMIMPFRFAVKLESHPAWDKAFLYQGS